MIAEMNSLVIKIQLPEIQIVNESFLEADEKVLEPIHHNENENENEEFNDEAVVNFNKKKDFELAQTLKKALQLLTSSSFKSAFHIQLSVKSNNQDQEQFSCEICSQKMKDDDERFENFIQSKISSIFHEAFTAEQKIHKQNLSSSSKTLQDLKNHSYRAEFEQTQRIHLESY